MIKIRTGRKSEPLTRKEKATLLGIMYIDNIGYSELAGRIGISYMQLYKPVRGNRNCSPGSAKKIRAYLEGETS